MKVTIHKNNVYQQESFPLKDLGDVVEYGIITYSEQYPEMVGGLCYRPTETERTYYMLILNSYNLFYNKDANDTSVRFRELVPGEKITITLTNN